MTAEGVTLEGIPYLYLIAVNTGRLLNGILSSAGDGLLSGPDCQY